MRSVLFRRFRLIVPVALLSLLVLSLGMSVQVGARGTNTNDEVTVVNLSGGPVSTTDNAVGVPIPLNGASSYTFTQKAGTAVQLIATTEIDDSDATFCAWHVIVYGDKLQARIDGATEKGEVGEGSGIGGLAAPATDTQITVQALVRELDQCDQEVEGIADEDTITVESLRVSVITLRN
jgi:hypothetical protein